MTDDTKLQISFGHRKFPDGLRAVWGARLIWPNDLVHDRQDLDSQDSEAKEGLIHWLNNGAIKEMRDNLTAPYSLGLGRDEDIEDGHTIYEDDKGKIVGIGRGGYVYVCGWLFEHDPAHS